MEQFEAVRLDRLPPPPETLKHPAAIREWNDCGRALIAAGLLTRANITVFEQRCALWGEMKAGWEKGIPVPSGRMGYFRTLTADLKLMNVNFGFVPSRVAHRPDGEGPVRKDTRGPKLPRGKRRRTIYREAPREARSDRSEAAPEAARSDPHGEGAAHQAREENQAPRSSTRSSGFESFGDEA